MSDIDLAVRLKELPPDLSHPTDRFQRVQARVRRRRSRQIAATTLAFAACAVLALTLADAQSKQAGEPAKNIATDPPQRNPQPAQDSALPGSDQITSLSSPRTMRATGTSTVQLGERPEGATSVSTDFTCLSAGKFRWPDGASIICSAEDVGADKPVSSPGYVIDLSPNQTEIVIKAGPGQEWEIVTTYVRSERIPWGINENGETYGVENEDGAPDLVAWGTPEGIQYVRNADQMAGPRTPAEAGLWMKNRKPSTIPTYKSDGTTILGTFAFAEPSGETSQEPRLVNGTPPPGAQEVSAGGVLTVTDLGCVYLDTPTGKRWLILPWGVYLYGSTTDGRLEYFDGTPVGDLNVGTTLTADELPGQVATAPCGTDLPPLYVTSR